MSWTAYAIFSEIHIGCKDIRSSTMLQKWLDSGIYVQAKDYSPSFHPKSTSVADPHLLSRSAVQYTGKH